MFLLALAAVAPPLLAAPSAAGDPASYGLELTPRPFPAPAGRGIPADLSVHLVLDDGQAEGVFGFAGSTARPFLWFQRFANPGPFTLEEVRVLFPSTEPVGGTVELAVYLDPNGDPTDGATLLRSWTGVIQVADDSTFSVYPVAPGLEIFDGAGDVLIGVIGRYFTTGVDPPPHQPAAVDTSSAQGRSWFALWSGDPPSPPELPPDLAIVQSTGAVGGNWLIRGFGIGPPVTVIPALAPAGLALLAVLLAAGGALLAGRSRPAGIGSGRHR